MISLKSILADPNTKIDQLVLDNIFLVEYRATLQIFVQVLDEEFEVEEQTMSVKGILFINYDCDPQMQVYMHLISKHFEGHGPVIIELSSIEVSGMKEWEEHWGKNDPLSPEHMEEVIAELEEVEEYECIDDQRSEEVDH